MTENDFIVSISFTEAAMEALGWKRGPAKQYPPVDLCHLRQVETGDFLRIEGMSQLWVVRQRVWHMMQDQTQLKLVLDGPIGEEI